MVSGPADRIARRLIAAPRRLPEEPGMKPALDALGGEVVRLRARDGVRLSGRWLAAEGPEAGGAGEPGDAAHAGPADAWVPDPREAILLLHGWSGSVTPDLVEVGPFLRRTANVLGLDFRGHGGSDDGPTTFGVLEVEDVGGALDWLGERGIARVALVGSSMGAITAIAAVGVLGDGRLSSADIDAHAPAASVGAPRPRIVAVVGDSAPADLATAIRHRIPGPFGRLLVGRSLDRLTARVGGDPRATEPIAAVGLLEDVPLLLINGTGDRVVRPKQQRRLVEAAPTGTKTLTIDGAGHGEGHRVDQAAYEEAVTGLLRDAFRGARS